jgi:hypothetical protein
MNLFNMLTNRSKANSTNQELKPNPFHQELIPETKPDVILSKLEVYLKMDYFAMGEHDGYQFHATSVLDNRRHVIRTDFHQLLDAEIELLTKQSKAIKNMIAESRDLDARRQEVLENDIEALQIKIDELQRQKALSIENEGWISGPFRKYQDGFIRGLHRYQDQERFAASTGMFFSNAKH